MSKYNLFLNQYILLNKNYTSRFKLSWRQEKFEDYVLFFSNDLKYYKTISNNNKIVLLGFVFHIFDPLKDENDIIEELPLEYNALLDYLNLLSGNFILILEINGELQIFHDAAGVMKVFYILDNNFIPGVSSDPKILKNSFSLEKVDDKNSKDFFNSKFFRKRKIRLGDKTSFRHVFQLLPNHNLNVSKVTIKRYFPKEPKLNISLDESIERVGEYFSNIIEASQRKYNLKCSLTAGWDSRIVLATTKKYKDSVLYYTFKRNNVKENSPDIKIPSKIANKLNLNHKIINVDRKLSSQFYENLISSYENFFTNRFDIIMNGFTNFNKKHDLVLVGAVSEICKNFYDDVNIFDGESLAKAAHFPILPYTITYFQKKFEELNILSNKYGYDIHDLAHWEQNIPNFAAQALFYNSFVANTFSPFNNRLILMHILSLPREYRDQHYHIFYKNYLEKYWPELNKFPINPTIKNRLILMGKKLYIYKFYKNFATQIRK